MLKFAKSLVIVASAAHLAVAPLAYSTSAYALAGDITLPPPYVSRAFDAVLIPIDNTVRTVFGLSATDQGVLVLATEPGGVADSQGILPGDVIYQVRGKKIVNPIDLDEVVYYWLLQNDYDFGFDYYRDGAIYSAAATITLELYETVIDVTTISSWSSWSTQTSFSYSEYYEEYSSEIVESYESSETTIEETVTSEEYAEEAIAEDASDDSVDDADSADDGIDDSENTDDNGDGVDDSEDDGSVDDGAEDDGSDDASENDGSDDDGGDDGSEDDGADEGGDEGGDE